MCVWQFPDAAFGTFQNGIRCRCTEVTGPSVSLSPWDVVGVDQEMAHVEAGCEHVPMNCALACLIAIKGRNRSQQNQVVICNDDLMTIIWISFWSSVPQPQNWSKRWVFEAQQAEGL